MGVVPVLPNWISIFINVQPESVFWASPMWTLFVQSWQIGFVGRHVCRHKICNLNLDRQNQPAIRGRCACIFAKEWSLEVDVWISESFWNIRFVFWLSTQFCQRMMIIASGHVNLTLWNIIRLVFDFCTWQTGCAPYLFICHAWPTISTHSCLCLINKQSHCMRQKLCQKGIVWGCQKC